MEETFPCLDALIIIHSDGLEEDDFLRLEIEERVRLYREQGKTVYNISTYQEPGESEDRIQIACVNGGPDPAYSLDDQMKELIPMLEENMEVNIEIVGGIWWYCVEGVRRQLEAIGLNPKVNYDCTDAISETVVIEEHGITGYRIPTLTASVIQRYRDTLD